MPESAPSSPATASREAVCSSAAPASVPSLSRAEVRELLFDLPWSELQALAHQCRLRHKGRHVHVRGLLEFSNVCRRNCRYCGLRHENRRLSRYSLSAAELLRAASQAVAAGVDTLVLQSGEMARNPLWLAQVVRGLKERFGLPVTLSVGEQPREWYALWREAGADRFLLKHETADARLYAALHPGYRLTDRLRALSWLAELGYEVGSGFMVGVPGQRPESLVDDILLVRDMRVAMCGAGPFVPQADTPLGRQPRGSTELCLRVMAVLRLALPWANLPATTALASLRPEDGQRQGLEQSGQRRTLFTGHCIDLRFCIDPRQRNHHRRQSTGQQPVERIDKSPVFHFIPVPQQPRVETARIKPRLQIDEQRIIAAIPIDIA